MRTLVIKDFKQAFANSCDIIVTPTSPTTAFLLGEKTLSPLDMYRADVFTTPASLAGLPGLSLPVGLDENRLPVGLQLLAAPFEEGRLLGVAQALEKACNFQENAQTRQHV